MYVESNQNKSVRRTRKVYKKKKKKKVVDIEEQEIIKQL